MRFFAISPRFFTDFLYVQLHTHTFGCLRKKNKNTRFFFNKTLAKISDI